MRDDVLLWKYNYLVRHEKGRRNIPLYQVFVKGEWADMDSQKAHDLIAHLRKIEGLEDERVVQIPSNRNVQDEISRVLTLLAMHGYRTNVASKKARDAYKVMLDGTWYELDEQRVKTLIENLLEETVKGVA